MLLTFSSFLSFWSQKLISIAFAVWQRAINCDKCVQLFAMSLSLSLSFLELCRRMLAIRYMLGLVFAWLKFQNFKSNWIWYVVCAHTECVCNYTIRTITHLDGSSVVNQDMYMHRHIHTCVNQWRMKLFLRIIRWAKAWSSQIIEMGATHRNHSWIDANKLRDIHWMVTAFNT